MLLQLLSCGTSQASQGQLNTYLSDSSARSSARSRSLSMITSLRATYRQKQVTFMDNPLLQPTTSVRRIHKACSWTSSHFLVNMWVSSCGIFSIHLGLCYLTFFKISFFNSLKGSFKIFFLPARGSLRNQGILSTVLAQRSEYRSPATLSLKASRCLFLFLQLQTVVFAIFCTLIRKKKNKKQTRTKIKRNYKNSLKCLRNR